ncbi:5'-nucleotidase [Paraburkholderia sprentiae WSM5005]|uniref:5'-nucleotidase n=1 Tax=Paraburkholderia sprentiae WSM5005 TaxID=754502 RepID=A0A1I9YCP0_9BURK|nr:5'-nucleotidase [Paraburkholderia sprentiae]APA84073.1 5'-nucleotidase [Paraburkholderia sprentiae WSM5005]
MIPGEKVMTVAVSARALFDFEEENRAFLEEDPAGYRALQGKRLDLPARPGAAFSLVRKLLALNCGDAHNVEVAILSRNDPVTGLRVFASARHHGLPIGRAIFTGGAAPHRYLGALGADLFLSANAVDVRAAMAAGFASARVWPEPSPEGHLRDDGELRIAFDGDSVLFSDEAERVFRLMQLERFIDHEVRNAHTPLPPGPLKPFLSALCRLRNGSGSPVSVRTALVTARSAPAHERAIRTLMAWGVTVDEAMFLGGRPKAPFLAEFGPDIFFDDQLRNCESASRHVTTGHVPYGINNEAEVALQ